MTTVTRCVTRTGRRPRSACGVRTTAETGTAAVGSQRAADVAGPASARPDHARAAPRDPAEVSKGRTARPYCATVRRSRGMGGLSRPVPVCEVHRESAAECNSAANRVNLPIHPDVTCMSEARWLCARAPSWEEGACRPRLPELP